MSEPNVYSDEMPKRLSDRDAELILMGQEPEDAGLARLGMALRTLHSQDFASPSEESVARFAAEAAMVARQSRSDVTVPTSQVARNRLRDRLSAVQAKIAVAALSLLVVVGVAGVATASDRAAPGHVLYGIDRALESIGINDGGTGERIGEARQLATAGEFRLAIDHVASAMEDGVTRDGPGEATEALRRAASKVESGDTETSSDEVRAAVATMLDEMANLWDDPELDGAEFGQRVAEMARSIGRGDNPGENESDLEQPGDAGPPQDVPEGDGPPDQAGPPQNRESEEPSGSTGPPTSTPGPPEDPPGQSEGTPGPPAGTPGPPEGRPGPGDGSPGPPAGTPGPPEGTPGPPEGTPGGARP